MTAQYQHETRLRSELRGFRFHEPLQAVWPIALQVLADHGYELVGGDRSSAGQPPPGDLDGFTGDGVATRAVDHRLVAETMEDDRGRFRHGLRYRVEGIDTGGGTCRVLFTGVQRFKDSLDVDEWRDLDLELELVRRIEPGAAARIEHAVAAR